MQPNMLLRENESSLSSTVTNCVDFESSATTTTGATANFTYDTTFHKYPPAVVISLSFTMIVFIVLATTGNILVVMTVVRHKGMRTRTNMFIVNLAAADILVAVFNMPFSLITVINGRWIFGEMFCQFNGFVVPLFFIVSIHTLMYISIHKYISITRPFSRKMTTRKILIMIVCAWLWGAVCAAVTLKGGNHVLYKKGTSQCGPSIPDELHEHIHSIMITTCNYIIPLIVMSFCYFHIFREIHEHMIRIRETSNVDLENSLDQQRRISCTLFLVLACFLVCWTPFIIYSCTLAFSKDKKIVPLIANPVAYWCGYMNSACNPIIYAFRSPSFRQGYKEIMCRQRVYTIGGSLVTRPSVSLYGALSRPTNRLSTLTNPDMMTSNEKISSLSKISALNGKLKCRRRPIKMSSFRNGLKHKIYQKEYASSPELPTLAKSTCKTEGEDKRNKTFNVTTASHSFRKRSLSLTFPNIDFVDKRRSCSSILKFYSDPHLLVDDRSNGYACTAQKFTERLSSFLNKTQETQQYLSENVKEQTPERRKTFEKSFSTINNLTPTSQTESTMQSESIYPVVIIDVASLRSSISSAATENSDAIQKQNCLQLFPNYRIKSQNLSLNSDLDVILQPSLLEKGCWSPSSTKSLEMGRCFKNSAKGQLRDFTEKITRRKDKEKPESPLYSASREQLIKWMSEDCLDRLEIAEKEFREQMMVGNSSFRLSHKLMSSFKKRKTKDLQVASAAAI